MDNVLTKGRKASVAPLQSLITFVLVAAIIAAGFPLVSVAGETAGYPSPTSEVIDPGGSPISIGESPIQRPMSDCQLFDKGGQMVCSVHCDEGQTPVCTDDKCTCAGGDRPLATPLST